MIKLFKNKKFLKVALVIFVLSFVLVASSVSAQGAGTTATQLVCTGTGLGTFICKIHKLLTSIVPVIISLGVVYFVWNVVQYVIADSDEAKSKGKDGIIFGITGLSVIIGVWGLVFLVVNTFGVGSARITPLTPTDATGTACTTVLGTDPKLYNLLNYGTCIIEKSVIPLLFALAFAYFIWGAVQFIGFAGGEESKRTEGRQHMIWGIVALAVMFGVWGLVAVVGDTFRLNTSVLPKVGP
jgi:hypothetical protein